MIPPPHAHAYCPDLYGQRVDRLELVSIQIGGSARVLLGVLRDSTWVARW